MHTRILLSLKIFRATAQTRCRKSPDKSSSFPWRLQLLFSGLNPNSCGSHDDVWFHYTLAINPSYFGPSTTMLLVGKLWNASADYPTESFESVLCTSSYSYDSLFVPRTSPYSLISMGAAVFGVYGFSTVIIHWSKDY